ncbi:GGDEF domain-containing protein [Virgisporangium aliadipatigenens]|uniref:GGDEF domain-containing protein n=1 Tax=Virgisporangium aliadipatigenens TaxID=741659 RepID=A0A8J4DQY1_9ACTN|nr:EAL domain-containing protein [Virgisporangium aliadipatigenens]GIJ47545.1 GGDEF domain-containing protein [Virgisporangium aliadipatigenens]
MRLHADGGGLESLVRRWAGAVDHTSHLEVRAPDLHRLLLGFAGHLAEALEHEYSDAGLEVGAELVAAGLTGPDALNASVTLLAEVPECVGRVDAVSRRRMAALLGGVAAGFARALHERTLAEQARVRERAFSALALAERSALDNRNRARAMFDAAGVAVAVSDLRGVLVEANPALAEMLGVPRAELVGRALFEFFHPDDVAAVRREVLERLAVAGRRDKVRVEKRFLRQDGTVGWTMLSLAVVRDEQGEPEYVIAIGEDVTDRHQLQRELQHQAHHDPLTGLPNRALLYDRLSEVLVSATPSGRIGVCYVDLDEFKMVNDTLGHHVGDQLLVTVSERLRRCVNGAGHFVARVGGDEFVVVMAGTRAPEEATALADDLLSALSEPVTVDGHQLSVSASVGIVERPATGTDPDEILRTADATLYWAKADGRNRWAIFDARRGAEQTLRYDLANQLPAALARQEFFLEYQPLVSLDDGSLRGAEALVRWRHPERGVLSPNLFIPTAEQSGNIVSLGRWVLREACEKAALWQSERADPAYVSVNVSARQCTEGDLVADVVDALKDTGLEPANLQLELTESAVMRSYDRPVEVLRRLAELGVRIVIDDFGIGYSNLAYLRNLPVHGLKLAGSFMAGIRTPEADVVGERIVESVVTLAHAVGISVTAEGVETADQAYRLAALGVDLGQGWHFGRPGRPDRIPVFERDGIHDGRVLP